MRASCARASSCHHSAYSRAEFRPTTRRIDTNGQPAALTLRPLLWHNGVPTSGADGRHRGIMKNGLYSIHVSLLDGRSGKGSGVIMFRDGKILGGDAYLFYTGSYTVKDDTFKGEVLVQRHTSSPDANPLFGGPNPVGIGVSGTFTDTAGHERHRAGRKGQPDFRRDTAQAGRQRLAPIRGEVGPAREGSCGIPTGGPPRSDTTSSGESESPIPRPAPAAPPGAG